ncbi:MAG: tail fiber domain-containing protein [Desulfatitalea sp.]|nr:tail fiber domain-containing protein [Desulfatitalea sp.]
MGGIVDSIFGGGGDDAADAATDAAEISAESQREALEYLKEREAIPSQFSDEATTMLGGLYGLEGGEGSQQALIDQAIASPLYGALMGGQEAGEDAILRSAAATGGLRSGNVQSNLYDYNTQLQNSALLNSYNQQLSGLHGLSGLGSNANQIASTMAGIGSTEAAGITAAAQAQQTANQQSINNLLGIGSLGVAMFSDRRLKKNIKLIGSVKGWPWYSWDWNIVAQRIGMKGSSQGIMADEVYARRQDCVIMKDFFMMVLYGKLGVLNNGHA